MSSPPGRSLRGLIRLSGPGAVDAAAALCNLEANDPPRVMRTVRLARPAIPALAVTLPGPNTFTGEDIVELQMPGHPALLDRLLRQAVDAGARLADPGEFTFRAFSAGRIDLTRAEGIAATIAAVSDGQLQAAAMLRQGRLGRIATELVDALGSALALVEAGIDFVDQEDVVPIGPAALKRDLAALIGRLDALLSRSRAWGAVEALPRVVLAGKPSAGKSTLFNALLGRRRAVTSPLPGTTRDVLAEPMQLDSPAGGRIEVMLVDVAGLDTPAAALDRDAQAAARRAIEQADLVLRLRDSTASRPVDDDDHDAASSPSPAPAAAELIVHAKADLAPAPSLAAADAPALTVSAVTGQGLDALRTAIARRVGDRGVSAHAQTLALQPRHEAGLRQALHHLRAADALLDADRDARAILAVELVAREMRAALDHLAGLGGQLTPDDVIGRVFATFCVGK